MLGTEFQDMLRCIRCGACMNHCPVYHAVGGHAYGWVYPGPMGAVLTPSLIGVDKAGHLPNASTFCGRCESVCPMRIPLPKMMRHWREREFERGLNPATQRYGLKLVGVSSPGGQRSTAPPRRSPCRSSACFGRRKGRFGYLPLAGGWTSHRDMPAPEGPHLHAANAQASAAQRAPRMSARDAILDKVRGALKAPGDDDSRRERWSPTRLEQGAERHHPGARTTARSGAHRTVLRQSPKSCRRRSSGWASATTCRRRLPPICGERNLPASFRMGDDSRLAAMPWRTSSSARDQARRLGRRRRGRR